MTKTQLDVQVAAAEKTVARCNAAAAAERSTRQQILDRAAAADSDATQLAATRPDLLRRISGGDQTALAALTGLGDRVDAARLRASDLREEAEGCGSAIATADEAVTAASGVLARARLERAGRDLHEATAGLDEYFDGLPGAGAAWIGAVEAYRRAHQAVHGTAPLLSGELDGNAGFYLARGMVTRIKAIVGPEHVQAVHARWPEHLASFRSLTGHLTAGRPEPTV